MSEFREWMAKILLCDVEDLPQESTTLRDIEGWDSLKHVLLVVSLENELNTKLTADQIQNMIKLADVAELFQSAVLQQERVDA